MFERVAPTPLGLLSSRGRARKSARSQQLRVRRNMGRLHMVEMPWREAGSPPRRPFRALSG
eukprot:13876467-Alexandrium_andersonii.AAC.1